MSSPAAGFEMLQKRKSKITEPDEITADEVKDNPVVKSGMSKVIQSRLKLLTVPVFLKANGIYYIGLLKRLRS
jgi:hypothetical protein